MRNFVKHCGSEALGPLRLAMDTQDAVSSGGTDGEQLGAKVVTQVEMTVALQGRDQLREKGHQTLGTDEVRSSPGRDKCLLDSRSIGALSRPLDRCGRGDGLGQEADGILAGIAGGGDELIKDERLLGVGGVLIAGSDLGN